MGIVFLVRDSYLKKDLALKVLGAAPDGSRGDRRRPEGVPPPRPALSPRDRPGLRLRFSRRPAVLHERVHPRGAAGCPRPAPGRRPPRTRPGGRRGRRLPPSKTASSTRQSSRRTSSYAPGSPGPGGPDRLRPLPEVPGRAPGSKLRGSLPYMAPEQIGGLQQIGGGSIGPWTDVYALGVALYRLATGRFPREGASGRAARAGDPEAWDPAPIPPPGSALTSPEIDHIVSDALPSIPARGSGPARRSWRPSMRFWRHGGAPGTSGRPRARRPGRLPGCPSPRAGPRSWRGSSGSSTPSRRTAPHEEFPSGGLRS